MRIAIERNDQWNWIHFGWFSRNIRNRCDFPFFRKLENGLGIGSLLCYLGLRPNRVGMRKRRGGYLHMSAATVLLDMERAQSMVADYVIKELYPTETPDFTVTIVATSGLTSQDDFRIFLTTDLPDGMLYTVVRLAGLPGWFLTAYKDVKKDEVE